MNEIDLHGMTHDDALIKAEDFVLLQSQDTIFQCRIITGNSYKMTTKIVEMLESHEFNWYIPTWNTGEIIVTH